MSNYKECIIESLEEARRNSSKLIPEILKLEGMTGSMTRHFYNNLIRKVAAIRSSTNYLEIGVWKGSSSVSSMYKNTNVDACFIDNWSEFNGPVQTFQSNIDLYLKDCKVRCIDQDCFKVDVQQCFEGGKVQIYLYDGGHEFIDHKNAITYYSPIFDDTCIVLVDDWNWKKVRDGTYSGIEASNLEILYQTEVRHTYDDTTSQNTVEFWNGIGIFILGKKNIISDQYIQQLYNSKVKLPASYFKKYEVMPPCPLANRNYQWNNNDFPRNWCVLDFIKWINKYNIQSGNTLGYTFQADDELQFLTYKNSTCLPYPPYDLHNISQLINTTFDFFIFNQTLEHLYNPFLAVKEIHKIVNQGGYVFTSVPTLNIPHMTPFHFNGFTPMGLAMLFVTAGFEVLEIGQWGNYDYIEKLWKTHEWPGYNDLQKNNTVVNEERNVCQCWILAKKPLLNTPTSRKAIL